MVSRASLGHSPLQQLAALDGDRFTFLNVHLQLACGSLPRTRDTRKPGSELTQVQALTTMMSTGLGILASQLHADLKFTATFPPQDGQLIFLVTVAPRIFS